MSTVDFFFSAQPVALHDYLTEASQSMLLEVFFWACVYTLAVCIFQFVARSVFSKMAFWHGDIKLRSGVFCANAQDDIVLLLCLGLHHLTAGLLCAYGAKHNNPDIWRHGYLLEVGFELADMLAMVANIYPYRYDNVKSDIKVALVFHHSNGVLFSGMIMNAGLHRNEHVQTIAFWLLAGAALSCFLAAMTHMLSLQTQMPRATLYFYVNTTFFLYCRFYIFPKESYALIQEVQADPLLAGTWVETGLYIAGGCLAIFNFGILSDIIPKCIRYTKRAMDGVTPLDTDEVPLSREDRMRRRRSSIRKAMDFVEEEAKRRRSSFATIVGMNAIEDIHNAEMESKEHAAISGDDMKALRLTMQNMGRSNKKTL